MNLLTVGDVGEWFRESERRGLTRLERDLKTTIRAGLEDSPQEGSGMRRVVVLLVALAALASAGPAWAADGCGADFQLLSVQATIELIDDRIYNATEWAEIQAFVASLDANGEGLLCAKQFKPNQGQDKHWAGPEDGVVTDYVITLFLDNTARGRAE
jgi:hypothetical protein